MRTTLRTVGFTTGVLAALVGGLPPFDLSLAGELPDSPRFPTYCSVGQVWPGYDLTWGEPGTIDGGGQTLSALVDPGDGCACSPGFELGTVTIYLTVPEGAPLPLTVTVSMELSEAVPGPAGFGSWVPGATLCETPVRDFTSEIPKPFVGFGIGLDCDCATMGPPYFLSFTVHSVMDPPLGFYTAGGGAPAEGRFLTRVDSQWVDLVAAGILTRGALVVEGSARCCEVPIAASARSWGSLKALYR